MLKTFIERHGLSTVISIIIVILGVLGLSTLPITQYQDIAPPTISVTATYPRGQCRNDLGECHYTFGRTNKRRRGHDVFDLYGYQQWCGEYQRFL